MRRILLTGSAGNLGTYLLRHASQDLEIHAVWRSRPPAWAKQHQLDLADGAAVETLFEEVEPELVIHTAFSSGDMARNIVGATRHIAEACRAHDAGLIHMSTDMVFDGEHGPYGEDARPASIFDYGLAKQQAEGIVSETVAGASIVRSSLILGLEPLNHSSAWLVENLRNGKPANLFVDEIRSPIGADDLSLMLWELARMPTAQRAGIWHLAAPEALSRFALGQLLARYFKLDCSLLRPALNRELREPRPRDLRLSTARADRELQHRPTPVSAILAPVG